METSVHDQGQLENVILSDYLRKEDVYKETQRNEKDFQLSKKLNRYIVQNRNISGKAHVLALCLKTSGYEDPSLRAHFLYGNLFSIARSLDKQRGLARRILRQTGHVPTDTRQQWVIGQVVGRMSSRLTYISGTVIPENVKLTPVSDYLRLTGKDWDEDMQDYMGFFLSEEETEAKRQEYVRHIFEAAGNDASYKSTLRAYVERRKDIDRKTKEEKEREKKEAERQKAEKKEDILSAACFHFTEDLKASLEEGCCFDTCMASPEDLKDRELANGYVVVQARYSKDNTKCTHYYKRGTGKVKNSTAYKLSSATVMSLEDAKAVCDKYYDKGRYLGVVFGIKECRVLYDPSKKGEKNE